MFWLGAAAGVRLGEVWSGEVRSVRAAEVGLGAIRLARIWPGVAATAWEEVKKKWMILHNTGDLSTPISMG